jgi:hypothetical protein
MSQATHTNITRRSILAGLGAAIPGGFAAASATASPGADSRLIDLGRQRAALKDAVDALSGSQFDEKADNLIDELWACEDAIVAEPARSLTGLLVKLDSAQAGIVEQLSGSGAPEPAFADLCETIRKLAHTGSLQA